MKKGNLTIAIVILAVVVLGVVGGILYYNYNKSHSYVATIAGEKVSVPEFRFFLGIIKNDYEKTAGVDIKDDSAKKDFWKTTKLKGENAEVTAKNDTLDQLKEFKILLIKAKESKIELDKTELDSIKSTIDELISSEGNGNRAAASSKIKEQYGISLSDYESIYKNYMLAYGKYAKEEADKIQPSDKELKDYYDKNKSKFGDVKVKHVLIMTKDPQTGDALETAQITEKKKLAEDTYQKAKNGGNFEDLVKQYSEDTSSTDSGGDLIVSKDDTSLDQKIRDWALSAKEGDIGMVETDYGYHILKFVKNVAFDDVTDQVKTDYQSDQVTKKLEEWKKEEKFNIEKNTKVLNSIKVM